MKPVFSTVFAADPWINSERSHGDKTKPEWQSDYHHFKSQLYWSLIFYDVTYIQDSYFLFNRKFESFLSELDEGQAAGLFKSSTPAISCVVRRHLKGLSLGEIDAKEVRGNGKFIWYWDGWPSEEYVERISELIPPTHRLTKYYHVEKARETLRNRVIEALTPGTFPFKHYCATHKHYEQNVRLHSGVITDLVDDGELTRSLPYHSLGYGVTVTSETRLPIPVRHFNKIPASARDDFRVVIDDIYRLFIADESKVCGLYPDFSLPPDHFITPPDSHLVQAPKPDFQALPVEILQQILKNKVKGPFGFLKRDLANLQFDQVWMLRERKQVKAFRKLLHTISAKRVLDARDVSDVSRLGSVVLTMLGEEIKRARGERYSKSALADALLVILPYVELTYLLSKGVCLLVGNGPLINDIVTLSSFELAVAGIVSKLTQPLWDEELKTEKTSRKVIESTDTFKKYLNKHTKHFHTLLPHSGRAS